MGFSSLQTESILAVAKASYLGLSPTIPCTTAVPELESAGKTFVGKTEADILELLELIHNLVLTLKT